MFHGLSETILTHKMAFLGVLMHLFLNIIIMSGVLLLMFVQSLVKSEAKEGE